MKMLRRLWRIALLIPHFLVGIFLLSFFFPKNQLPNARQQKLTRWWLGRFSRLTGVKAQLHGQMADKTVLLVSNHISWADIPLIGGYIQGNFLSKAEVADWPLIGWLASRSGTLFIKRGRKEAAQQAHEQMVEHLNHRHSLVLFPEGTTTDGQAVKKFRARLFQTAIDAQTPVQCLTLHYHPNEQGQNYAPYIGDDDFVSHAWRLLGEKHIRVELQFGPIIELGELNRDELSQQAETQVTSQLQALQQRP